MVWWKTCSIKGNLTVCPKRSPIMEDLSLDWFPLNSMFCLLLRALWIHGHFGCWAVQIAVLEEQKNEDAENEAAEKVDDDSKSIDTESTPRGDILDEKPDINDLPMEESKVKMLTHHIVFIFTWVGKTLGGNIVCNVHNLCSNITQSELNRRTVCTDG